MDWTALLGTLAFFTLLAGVTLAFVSKQQVEQRMQNPQAEKSTLAKNKSSNGKPADV